ncbi:MAG TPA: hypothetical protein VLE19_15620 [Pyrinomonadaceae bacterium]|nr:hypothetical protein [Pyrinomonadaceae bacterium]
MGSRSEVELLPSIRIHVSPDRRRALESVGRDVHGFASGVHSSQEGLREVAVRKTFNSGYVAAGMSTMLGVGLWF